MAPERREQTFEVIGDEPCMGYVPGEEFTVIDLEQDREEEFLRDGQLKYVSGDKPRASKVTPPVSPGVQKGQR